MQAVNAQIKGGVRNMRTLMAVAPFAAISSSSVHTLMLITRAVSSFIKLYLLLLFMRVLLSWFPAFNWEDQPWLALRQVCTLSTVRPHMLLESLFIARVVNETHQSRCLNEQQGKGPSSAGSLRRRPCPLYMQWQTEFAPADNTFCAGH